MSYRPDIAAQMRGIVNLDRVIPHLWAKTYEASGITEADIIAARDAEAKDRADREILRKREEANGE